MRRRTFSRPLGPIRTEARTAKRVPDVVTREARAAVPGACSASMTSFSSLRNGLTPRQPVLVSAKRRP